MHVWPNPDEMTDKERVGYFNGMTSRQMWDAIHAPESVAWNHTSVYAFALAASSRLRFPWQEPSPDPTLSYQASEAANAIIDRAELIELAYPLKSLADEVDERADEMNSLLASRQTRT